MGQLKAMGEKTKRPEINKKASSGAEQTFRANPQKRGPAW